MSMLPLDPSLAKVLLTSDRLHCTTDVVAIISLLSADSLFFTPAQKRKEANVARAQFLSPLGDHITLLNLYRAYRASQAPGSTISPGEWCQRNFVNRRSLRRALDVERQLLEYCTQLHLTMVSAHDDLDTVCKAFVAGFFTNVATRLPGSRHYRRLNDEQDLFLHPSSALQRHKPDIVLYTELVFTTRLYMRSAIRIDLGWLHEVAPQYFLTAAGQQ
jgi:ATP-dependent RNA helicase DHX8/PRP22